MRVERQEEMKTPCPFCCSTAHVYQILDDFRDRWGVGCCIAGCPASFNVEVAYYVQKEAAINRWEDRSCAQEN